MEILTATFPSFLFVHSSSLDFFFNFAFCSFCKSLSFKWFLTLSIVFLLFFLCLRIYLCIFFITLNYFSTTRRPVHNQHFQSLHLYGKISCFSPFLFIFCFVLHAIERVFKLLKLFNFYRGFWAIGKHFLLLWPS